MFIIINFSSWVSSDINDIRIRYYFILSIVTM
ncbi:hypothetical protein [Companilactobacillus kimchii]